MMKLVVTTITFLFIATSLQASYTQEQLLSSVNALAKRLPMQVDGVTRISSVRLLNNNVIQYDYTVDMDKIIEIAALQANTSVHEFKILAVSKFGSVENLLEIWAKTILGKFIETTNCTTPSTREWLNNGLSLVHVIYNDSGTFIYETTINIENCN